MSTELENTPDMADRLSKRVSKILVNKWVGECVSKVKRRMKRAAAKPALVAAREEERQRLRKE